jgi:PAS domain S-box-containing protein
MVPPGPDALESAIRDIGVPALVTNERMVLTEVSEGTVRATGYDRQELIGKPASIVAADPAEFADVAETVAAGRTWSGTFTVRCADDRRIRGHGSTTPVTVGGDRIGYFGTFTDTTRRRRYENATKVLGRVMRHDLRHELNLLLGDIDAAKRTLDGQLREPTETDPDAGTDPGGGPETGTGTGTRPGTETAMTQACDRLQRATERLWETVSMIDRASDLRRTLDRSAEDAFRVVQLDAVLEAELEAVRQRYPSVIVERSEEFPEVTVLADDLINVAIGAVLENAVVHNPSDHPRMTVRVILDERSATVEIADDGPGIPPERRDQVFGREERGQLDHGTGLDLFVVESVLEEYGGEAFVEDNDPQGAVFGLQFVRATPNDDSDAG